MPHANPIVRAEYRRANYQKNKAKRLQQMKEYREAHKDEARERWVKSYGITIEQYNQMFSEQEGKCKICKSIDPGSRREYFCIDHDHVTNKVRGLLCSTCNLVLGMCKDNIQIVNNLIIYLSESKNG